MSAGFDLFLREGGVATTARSHNSCSALPIQPSPVLVSLPHPALNILVGNRTTSPVDQTPGEGPTPGPWPTDPQKPKSDPACPADANIYIRKPTLTRGRYAYHKTKHNKKHNPRQHDRQCVSVNVFLWGPVPY